MLMLAGFILFRFFLFRNIFRCQTDFLSQYHTVEAIYVFFMAYKSKIGLEANNNHKHNSIGKKNCVL